MRGDWGWIAYAPRLYPGSTRSFKTMPSMWIHLLGGVTWFLCPNMGIVTSIKSHGLNTRCWLVEKISAALWLVGTQWSPMYYCSAVKISARGDWGRIKCTYNIHFMRITSVIEWLLLTFLCFYKCIRCRPSPPPSSFLFCFLTWSVGYTMIFRGGYADSCDGI